MQALRKGINLSRLIFGGNDAEVTPVPIPNTVVKLCSADGTWWEAARESRSLPEQKRTSILDVLFLFSFIRHRRVVFA